MLERFAKKNSKENDKPKFQFFSKLGQQKMPTRSEVRVYLMIGCLLISMFIAAMDIVIALTIIETISEDFHSYSKSGWVLSAYSLSSALSSLIAGKFSLKIGLKSSIILSIIIFQIGSLISGVCTSMNMLIGSRVISGIGAGSVQTLCYISVPLLVGQENIGRTNSYFSSCYGLAAFVGCFVGVSLESHWKVCYLINIPIGCVPLILIILLFPSTRNNESKTTKVNLSSEQELNEKHEETIFTEFMFFLNTVFNFFKSLGHKKFYVDFIYEAVAFFDIIGFAFFSIGFTLLLVGLTYGVESNPSVKAFDATSSVIAMFVFSGVFLILAVFWEISLYGKLIPPWYFNKYGGEYMKNELIARRLLTEWKLISLNICNFCIGLGFFAIMFYAIQYYLLVLGKSASDAISHYTCFVASPIAALIAGSLNRRTGFIKEIIVVCTAIGCVGAGLLSKFNKNSSGVLQSVALVLCSIIYDGTVQTVLLGLQVQVTGYEEVSQLDKAKATAKFQKFKAEMTSFTSANSFFRVLGSSLAGVISNVVFDVTLKRKVQENKNLPATIKNFSVNEIIDYRAINFDSAFSPLGTCIADAIVVVFWVCFAFYIVAFITGSSSANKRSLVKALNDESGEGLEQNPGQFSENDRAVTEQFGQYV